MDGRTREAKEYQRLVAEWIAALPPAPHPSRIAPEFEGGGTPFEMKIGGGVKKNIAAKIDPVRRGLIERGCALQQVIREAERSFLTEGRIEAQTYERMVRALLVIQSRLGLVPGKVSPQSKQKAKPGPKPSNLSPHAKAVLKATEDAS